MGSAAAQPLLGREAHLNELGPVQNSKCLSCSVKVEATVAHILRGDTEAAVDRRTEMVGFHPTWVPVEGLVVDIPDVHYCYMDMEQVVVGAAVEEGTVIGVDLQDTAVAAGRVATKQDIILSGPL